LEQEADVAAKRKGKQKPTDPDATPKFHSFNLIDLPTHPSPLHPHSPNFFIGDLGISRSRRSFHFKHFDDLKKKNKKKTITSCNGEWGGQFHL
jgi:hypothetical protein